MGEPALAAQSCLASAARWRQEAEALHDRAARCVRQPIVAHILHREAEAADRQAQWWEKGAAASGQPRYDGRGRRRAVLTCIFDGLVSAATSAVSSSDDQYGGAGGRSGSLPSRDGTISLLSLPTTTPHVA